MTKNTVCIITGIGGLIGSEAAKFYSDKFDLIVGIDCDARKEFFGEDASVRGSIKSLENSYHNIIVYNTDIVNRQSVEHKFDLYKDEIKLIIHTAAQPSHDYATNNVHRDFEVNALGTLNLLEAYRQYCPEAVFIFTSTNKVYGDTPNLVFNREKLYPVNWEELETRYERYSYPDIFGDPELHHGIDESMSIDQTTHSLFGVSKASADLMVQEYGRYFGLKTVVFRGGCLTGGNHQGTQLHGFLSYLVKCIKHERPYTIFGFKGKQVRDQIHSVDMCRSFDEFYRNPRSGMVYNIGGGRHSNCSVLEAIDVIERKTGKKAILHYVDKPRRGDHQWYISDVSKFKRDYPSWGYTYTLEQIIDEIIQSA